MKWLIVSVCLISGIFSKAQLPSMEEILLILPDSAFKYCKNMTKSKSFSVKERKMILTDSDSALLHNPYISDSLHEFSVAGGDYISLQIKYWVKSKNEIYIAIIESDCDFVMCKQNNSFYTYKKGKLSPLNLDYYSIPLLYFFHSKALEECDLNPKKGTSKYTLSLEKGVIYVDFQLEYIQKELMGEDGEYVCLEDKNASLKDQQSVLYLFDGKKFKLVLPH